MTAWDIAIFVTAVSQTVGNYTWAAMREKDWDRACERSYFQIWALATAWAIGRVTE